MPQKTIYVAEEDLPLLERAQRLSAGNLSAAVVRALRRFVDASELETRGFEEITVQVGTPWPTRCQRFFGRRLAAWRRPDGRGRVETLIVYRTRAGRLAVHRSDRPDWNALADADGWEQDREHAPSPGRAPVAGGAMGAPAFWQAGAASLEVYDSVEALAMAALPAALVEAVRAGLDAPVVEDLDI